MTSIEFNQTYDGKTFRHVTNSGRIINSTIYTLGPTTYDGNAPITWKATGKGGGLTLPITEIHEKFETGEWLLQCEHRVSLVQWEFLKKIKSKNFSFEMGAKTWLDGPAQNRVSSIVQEKSYNDRDKILLNSLLKDYNKGSIIFL